MKEIAACSGGFEQTVDYAYFKMQDSYIKATAGWDQKDFLPIIARLKTRGVVEEIKKEVRYDLGNNTFQIK